MTHDWPWLGPSRTVCQDAIGLICVMWIGMMQGKRRDWKDGPLASYLLAHRELVYLGSPV